MENILRFEIELLFYGFYGTMKSLRYSSCVINGSILVLVVRVCFRIQSAKEAKLFKTHRISQISVGVGINFVIQWIRERRRSLE